MLLHLVNNIRYRSTSQANIMSFAACWITLLLLSIGSHAKSLKIGFRRRFTDGSDAIRTDSLESRERQRDLLDEFGATTISEIQKSPIVMEDLAALIVTMDSGMSYMMDPTQSPTQSPSKSPTSKFILGLKKLFFYVTNVSRIIARTNMNPNSLST